MREWIEEEKLERKTESYFERGRLIAEGNRYYSVTHTVHISKRVNSNCRVMAL